MLVGRNIICFAGAQASSAEDEQQVMKQLARDNRVLWVDSSPGPRKLLAGLEKVGANCWRVKPMAMSPSWLLARRLCLRIARRQLQSGMRAAGLTKPISWAFSPEFAEVVGSLGETFVIYHGLRTGALHGESAAARDLLRRADLVIVASAEELEAHREVNPSIHVVTRGQSESWDAALAQISELAAGVRPAQVNVAQRVQELPAFQNVRLEFVRHFFGRDSEFFEYRIAGKPQQAPMLVKRIMKFRDPAQAERLILHEHGALEWLQARAGALLGDSVPAPMGAIPAAWALVMTKMPGVPLSTILKRDANRLTGFLHRERLCEIAGAMGIWLQKFHAATRDEPLRYDPQAFMHEVRRRLAHCSELGLSAAFSRQVWELVEQACDKLRGRPVPTGARHGDFIPQNVLVAEGGIAVIDFEDSSERDAVYEDAGTMLAYFLLLEGWPAYSRRTIAAARQCFLEAYGIAGPDVFLALYTLKAAIKALSEFDRRKRSLQNDFRFARMQQQIRRMCKSLEEHIEFREIAPAPIVAQ